MTKVTNHRLIVVLTAGILYGIVLPVNLNAGDKKMDIANVPASILRLKYVAGYNDAGLVLVSTKCPGFVAKYLLDCILFSLQYGC